MAANIFEGAWESLICGSLPGTDRTRLYALRVGIHATAKPLALPVDGGGPEKTSVRVEPLLTGTMKSPRAFFERTGGRLEKASALGLFTPRSRWWQVPVPAFLIHHPTKGEILVDTGLHSSVAASPAANLGRAVSWFAKPKVEPDQDLLSQLRERDIDSKEIKLILLTHMHYDHTSGIAEFPNATFVVTNAEWLAATTDSQPALRGYRPAHFDYLFDYRTVSFDGPEVSSYASFGRTIDLLGDGSIRLAYTPGHSAGHQSIICRLKDRDLVIAGDAIYTSAQLDDAPPPPFPVSEHTWKRSMNELKRFRDRYPDAVIIPGHDPAAWAELKPSYE